MLQPGQPAPGFKLAAANRRGGVSLKSLLSYGHAVVEFLRGTW